MHQHITAEELQKLFTKPYGTKAPSKNMWASYYEDDVLFIDPTQEKFGLDAYIEAQENLLKRCEDVYLETHAVAINQNIGFVEWTLILKILNREFIYPGTSRLTFGKSGRIKEQRDYFDFCGPTFSPVPILGSFIKWLYSKFVS
tara:strand:- start:1503 stop:1934 length:432 start_codon:yes stop_codon:yes gene_type:complete